MNIEWAEYTYAFFIHTCFKKNILIHTFKV